MSVDETYHQKFLQNVIASDAAVMAVARWFRMRKHYVAMPPIHLAKAHAEWKKASDSGDLFLWRKESKRWDRIEVKCITSTFTSRADWPFRDKFIVCSRHSFDRAKRKPFCYLILNPEHTHVGAVFVSTSESWHVEQRADSKFGGMKQDFYFCPLDLVKFFPLHPPTEER